MWSITSQPDAKLVFKDLSDEIMSLSTWRNMVAIIGCSKITIISSEAQIQQLLYLQNQLVLLFSSNTLIKNGSKRKLQHYKCSLTCIPVIYYDLK